MKKTTISFYCTICIAILLTTFSCNQDSVPDISDYANTLPEHVHLSDHSGSAITVAWDSLAEAASYTVELLDSMDSDSPLDAYTTASNNYYKFIDLEDTLDYYVRVRANFNTVSHPVIGDWVYLMNGENPARIIPAYGIVNEDFKIPRIYAHFPEGFEEHDGDRKKSYTATGPTGRQSDVFPSGEWLMDHCYTTNSGTALIHKVGNYATMMAPKETAYLAMDFDLPNGATRFTFICGAATRTNANETTGMPITLSVAYSQDGGNTWTKLGDDILIDDIETQYHPDFDNLDIEGPVRFRISKNDSRARPIIDEVTVYYVN